LTSVGKLEYKIIGRLRDELEKSLVFDLPNLYKIDSFLSQKEIVTKYEERDISKKPETP